jgi:hypothetical protein
MHFLISKSHSLGAFLGQFSSPLPFQCLLFIRPCLVCTCFLRALSVQSLECSRIGFLQEVVSDRGTLLTKLQSK